MKATDARMRVQAVKRSAFLRRRTRGNQDKEVSEVERQGHLQQSWRDDALGRQPGGVRRADLSDRIVVEDVEQVHTHSRPGAGETKDLPESEVDLIQPRTVQRSRGNDIDVRRLCGRSARRQPAKAPAGDWP